MRTVWCARCFILVEMAGIEPASKNTVAGFPCSDFKKFASQAIFLPDRPSIPVDAIHPHSLLPSDTSPAIVALGEGIRELKFSRIFRAAAPVGFLPVL